MRKVEERIANMVQPSEGDGPSAVGWNGWVEWLGGMDVEPASAVTADSFFFAGRLHLLAKGAALRMLDSLKHATRRLLAPILFQQMHEGGTVVKLS